MLFALLVCYVAQQAFSAPIADSEPQLLEEKKYGQVKEPHRHAEAEPGGIFRSTHKAHTTSFRNEAVTRQQLQSHDSQHQNRRYPNVIRHLLSVQGSLRVGVAAGTGAKCDYDRLLAV